jgi:hypothetical protein
MKKQLAFGIALLLSMLPMGLADDVTVNADVNKYISVTFNYATVSFGALTQGTTDNAPTPSYTTGVYNVSIDTNFAYRSKVSGINFDAGGGKTFVVGNLTVDADETLLSLSVTNAVTGTPTTVTSSSSYGTGLLDYNGYLLDIPSNQYAGSYSSTITWTYENQ